MKQGLLAVIVAVSLMFSAGSVSAGDADVDMGAGDGNIGIGLGIDNRADANAIAEQEQNQQQEQEQRQTVNFNNLREHIMVQPGPQGNFVSAPMVLVGNWTPLLCSPLFASFSAERIHQMSASDSFWGGVKIKKVVHVSRNGNRDNNQSVNLIGWDVREGAYASDQLLGEFQCQGEYGMPMGAALGRCLEEAQKTTGTTRVFAAYKLRRDPKNSGFSIGSGAAGAKMLGSSGAVDEVAGAISLGGLIGTTRASVDEAYDWTVLALNDGPLTRVVEPTSCIKPPVAQPPAPKTCDPSSLLRQLEEYVKEIIWCWFPCLNNEKLRLGKGNINMHLFYCTGDRKYLRDAIHEYGIGERDFLNGRELAPGQHFGEKPKGVRTTTLPEANDAMYKIHYNRSLAVRELEGREAQIAFARSKKLHLKGDRTMPTGEADIKN